MTEAPVLFTVYPGDCDTFGHLNQAAFLAYFERARWQMLAGGPGMDLFERAGVWPAVRHAVIDYHAPAYPGHTLRFHLAVTRLGRTSFTMRQVARRESDDVLIATAESVFVCIDKTGAAVPVPAEVAAFLLPAHPAAASTTRRVSVHGLELALDDRGSGPGVALPPWLPARRESSGVTRPGPSPAGAPSFPTFEGSAAAMRPILGYSMATYADDLAAMLDAVGVDEVVLAGLSMGGYVAFEFLRRHRPRVRALVLVDTRATADSAEGRKGREIAMADAREGGAPLIAEQMLPKLLAKSAPHALSEEVRAIMAGAPVPGLLGALAAMRDRPDSTDLLAGLKGLPTLVLVGAEDVLTPPREAEGMAKAIPGAKLAIIPNAGHLAPLEQPEAFNRHLRRAPGQSHGIPTGRGVKPFGRPRASQSMRRRFGWYHAGLRRLSNPSNLRLRDRGHAVRFRGRLASITQRSRVRSAHRPLAGGSRPGEAWSPVPETRTAPPLGDGAASLAGTGSYRSGRPGGLSLSKTSRFFSMNAVYCGGTSSSGKMAVTGHSGSQAPQSIHSSALM